MKLISICGPAGCGKSTIINKLLHESQLDIAKIGLENDKLDFFIDLFGNIKNTSTRFFLAFGMLNETLQNLAGDKIYITDRNIISYLGVRGISGIKSDDTELLCRIYNIVDVEILTLYMDISYETSVIRNYRARGLKISNIDYEISESLLGAEQLRKDKWSKEIPHIVPFPFYVIDAEKDTNTVYNEIHEKIETQFLKSDYVDNN